MVCQVGSCYLITLKHYQYRSRRAIFRVTRAVCYNVVMSAMDVNHPKISKQTKMNMAGLVAIGIGGGYAFDLVAAGFFIGLGAALLAAARSLETPEAE